MHPEVVGKKQQGEQVQVQGSKGQERQTEEQDMEVWFLIFPPHPVAFLATAVGERGVGI